MVKLFEIPPGYLPNAVQMFAAVTEMHMTEATEMFATGMQPLTPSRLGPPLSMQAAQSAVPVKTVDLPQFAHLRKDYGSRQRIEIPPTPSKIEALERYESHADARAGAARSGERQPRQLPAAPWTTGAAIEPGRIEALERRAEAAERRAEAAERREEQREATLKRALAQLAELKTEVRQVREELSASQSGCSSCGAS